MPSVTLSTNKDFVGESDLFKEAVITATSSGPAGDTIKVLLSTSGTGTPDADYELTSDTIFILPGNTTGTIKLTAKWLAENDPTEGEENVTLILLVFLVRRKMERSPSLLKLLRRVATV